MIDDTNLRGKIGVVGSGKSIYVLSLFLMNIGLARSMGIELFGSFQQVFMFTAVFMILSMGIPETMYFYLPRLTPEERSGFLGRTLLLLCFSGALTALVIWLAAPKLAEIQGNPGIVTSLRFFGIYGAFLIASSFADPLFITFRRLKFLFLVSSLHGLFFILLTVWQYTTGTSLFSLFLAIAAFGLGKFIVSLVLLHRMKAETGPITFSGSKYSVLLQLGYSFPIALSSAVEMISKWMDKFVISVYFGPEALGIFFVGAIEIPFVSVLLSSVFSVISPVLNKLHHKGDNQGFAIFVGKTIKFTAKIIWPLFIYLMFFADHLIPLVFKSEYASSVAPFRVYLIMMPVRIALYGVIIIALGKTQIVFWTSLGAMLINLILNVLFVKWIGFLGPAIATVISTYLHVAVFVAFIVKSLKVRFTDLIPVRAFFDIGLACIIAALTAFLMTQMIANDLSVVILSLSIFVGAYIFLGSKAGFIQIMNLTDFVKGASSGDRNNRPED